MLGPLFLLFTLVPALELYLLFQVGGVIGGFNTIMLIIITGIVGASLAKSQGFSILTKIQEQTNRGELPADQIIQGLMVFAGGLLLLTPGFMTDIFGFLLVMPGSRHLLVGMVRNAVMRGMKNGNFQFRTFNAGSGGFSYSSYSGGSQDSSQSTMDPRPAKPIQPGVFEAEYTEKKSED